MKKIALLTSLLALAACGGGSGSGGHSSGAGSNITPGAPDVLAPLTNLTDEEIALARNATSSHATVNNADDLIARAQAVYGDITVSEADVSRSAVTRNSAKKHNNDKLSRAEKHFENARKMLGDKDWFKENFDNISESDFAKACQLLNIKFANKQEFFDKLDDKNFWNEHHHNVNSAHNKLTIEDMYTGGFSMGTQISELEVRVKDVYSSAEEAAEWLSAYGLEWSDITDNTYFDDIEKPMETTRLLVDKETGDISFATYYAPGTNMHYEIDGEEDSEIRYLQIDQGTNGCLTGTPCDCSSEYGCLFNKIVFSNINNFKNGYAEFVGPEGEFHVTFLNNINQENIGLKYSDILAIDIYQDGELVESDSEFMGYDSKRINMEDLAKNNKIEEKVTYSGKAIGAYNIADEWIELKGADGKTAVGATLEFDPNSGAPTEKILAKFSELGWYDINVTKQYDQDGFDMSATKTEDFDSDRFADSANGLTFDPYSGEYNVQYYGDKSSEVAEEVVGNVQGNFNVQNAQGSGSSTFLGVDFTFGATKDRQ